MIGRRDHAPSAVAAIGGFGIGVALLSVAATATIVLVAPEPDGVRVSIRDAAVALQGDPGGFDRRIGGEPEGRRAILFEAVLADQLRRPPGDVRLVMTGPAPRLSAPPATAARGAPESLVVIRQSTQRTRAGPVQVRREEAVMGGDDLRVLDPRYAPPPGVRSALAVVPINAFVAGVRQPDGRWLTVEPSRTWFSGWRVRVLAAILVSLLLIVPLAWLFARRLTRPFRALAKAVDERDAAIPIAGPRELREAAGAIAAMRARLADEAAERLRMLTAIAHDLRTPLTSLRLRLDATAEPQRSRMIADVERMRAMIGEVLDFARAADVRRQVVAVAPLVAEIVAEMDPGRGLVTMRQMGAPSVEVSEAGFRRAIENLVCNAIDHAGGGAVDVAIDGDEAIVAVSDRGPGIPAADRARLLRPFERGDASRNRDTGGAGLGLSIVRDFADRHGGALSLSDREEGGLRAEIRLPAWF